jgi:predicted nucleic acid-binding protein
MFVIDASVYVSRLRREEAQHAESARLFEAVAALRAPVLCPEILLPEVAAALARGLDDPDFAHRAAAHLRRLPGHRFIAVDRVLSGLAARLAAERRLRGCDAIYAALARREGIPLVTWDEQQRNRAAPVVEALTPSEVLAALEADPRSEDLG